jgi:starvation-inducible DNA-binding protein
MTAIAELPTASEQARVELRELLQATLVELIALSLVGKQLHWNVAGPGFREIHLQLDELVVACRDLLDVVAERQAAIGISPDGRGEAVVASGLDPGAAGPVDAAEAVRLISGRVADVAQRVRSRLERVGELDLVSQGILIEVSRTLEQHLWMFRAQLPQGGS